MNQQKIQQFGTDVVHDLRSRGLLPVVALLAVGLIAVPMLIKGGGDDTAPPPPAPIPGTVSGNGGLNEPAVLTYNPSVRDYKERLSNLQQKDPFIQQFSAPAATEAASDTAQVSTSGGSGSAPTSSGGSSGGGTGPSTVDDTQGDVTPEDGSIVYFYAETDILIGQAGSKLKRRNAIPELSFLPSEKNPVLVYMGATRNLKHAVFLVSDEAQVTDGQKHCTGDPADCDAVQLKDGDAVSLLNAIDGKTYRLKVLDLRLVRSTKPPDEK